MSGLLFAHWPGALAKMAGGTSVPAAWIGLKSRLPVQASLSWLER